MSDQEKTQKPKSKLKIGKAFKMDPETPGQQPAMSYPVVYAQTGPQVGMNPMMAGMNPMMAGMNPMMAGINPMMAQQPAPQPVPKTEPSKEQPKVKNSLRNNSEPFQKRQKEKEEEANDYWGEPEDLSANTPNGDFFVQTPHQFYENSTWMDKINQEEEGLKMLDNLSPEEREQLAMTLGFQEEEEVMDAQIKEIMDDLEKEEKFNAAMKDCACCKGYTYSCKGKICKSLGVCKCVAHLEMEDEAEEHFIPECQNCDCCRGYVYTCQGEECKVNKVCKCFDATLA